MKRKMFLFGLCLCIGFSAMAQADDDFSAAFANKRGVYLLPQAGDFALGIDATPLLRYMGNFFSSSFNPAPLFNGVDGVNVQTIYGKYFLEDNRAIRARLSIGMSNYADKYAVPDDEAIADAILAGETPGADLYTKLTDIQRGSYTGVELGVGYEFRRGNGRVQGFYGGEVFLGYEGGKTKYEYANGITEDNKTPSRYNYSYTEIINGISCRVTEDKAGKTIYAGLGAFAGVEYFFAPQMSIGGEFGLGFRFTSNGQSTMTGEGWDSSIGSTGDLTTQSQKGTGWGYDMRLDTYPSGRITLMFHF